MTDTPDIPGTSVGPWADFQAAPAGPWEDFKRPNAPGVLESIGRGAAEGATFGFDDKLGLSKERREASRAANPWAHFAGELIGGALPMAAASLLPTGAGQVAAGARAANLATKGAGLVRSALVPGQIGSLGDAMLQGTKLGSVYGALSGAGHADVAENDPLAEATLKRAAGATTGMAEGALMGPVLGVVGHGVYRGAQGLGGIKAASAAETADQGAGALTTAVHKLEQDRITPDQLIDQIRAEFPDPTATAPGGLARRFWGNATGQGKQPITADQVDETVRRAMLGQTADQISHALSPGGKGTGPGESAVQTLLDELAERHLGPLNLVDRAALIRKGAGDNTQMSMRAAAATPGEHVGIARENLLERQAGAGGRLGQLFDRLIGSSDYEGVAAKHASDLENAGARAYGTAFANEKPFDLNPIFNKWVAQYQDMAGPIPRGVMSALNDMRVKQPVLDQAGNLANVPKDGIVNQSPPQDLQGFILARQGLSDSIQSAKQNGEDNLARKLTQLHQELSQEVGRTNPDWVSANQIWRDGKAAQDAQEAGARMTTRLNANSRDNLAEFTDAQTAAQKAAKDLRAANTALNAAGKAGKPITPQLQSAADTAQARLDAANSRQELFKVGLVRSLNDMIANQGETHNLTRQLLLPGAKQQISRVLGNDADQFFKTVQAEAAMHRTYASQFGSQTTPLREAIEDQSWAPKFEAAWYNPMQWPGKVAQLAHEYAARSINASRNKDLMGLYTQTDPLQQLQALRAMQSVHAARSAAGNTFGRPVVSTAGPGLDALLGQQTDANQSLPSPAQTTRRP